MTKIKKMELESAGEHKIVKVTFEKKGAEYTFTAKATDVLDEKKFESLIKFWTEKMIPEREAEAGLTDKGIEVELEKIKRKPLKMK